MSVDRSTVVSTVDCPRSPKSEILHTSVTTGTEGARRSSHRRLIYDRGAHGCHKAEVPDCGARTFTRCANLRRRREFAVTFADGTRVSEVPRRVV